eukprot:Phypoly_transcript_29950.p1 GENE.Phypoly_transcript_29950~~Phypoly_transcript_29950.p1  ORF type:complete len:103 (+),score=2.08 Phypoly_transcript_29950:31-339(+)
MSHSTILGVLCAILYCSAVYGDSCNVTFNVPATVPLYSPVIHIDFNWTCDFAVISWTYYVIANDKYRGDYGNSPSYLPNTFSGMVCLLEFVPKIKSHKIIYV